MVRTEEKDLSRHGPISILAAIDLNYSAIVFLYDHKNPVVMKKSIMVHKSILTKTTELVKQKPFTIVLLSILFGIAGAFVDAIIDHLFYYEESLFEVFVPNFSSHEFYMRVMLILTLTTFAFLIALLLIF